MPLARRALALATALAAAAGPARAAPRLVVELEDAARDANGPGTYVPPGDTEFADGDFDLRRFAVLEDGEDVVLEVTLGAVVRPPASTYRTNSSPIELANGIYLQNVDVYVDRDGAPGSGVSACIPGRRVAFAGGRGWEIAVVLTPQPGPARALVAQALGADAARVVFAEGLEARGRTIVARVPAAALGGPPRKDWGWSVHVSGARWERSYALADRLLREHEADAFTLPVLPVAEAWAFGGAPRGSAHPRVVDVLLPAGADQRAVLGSFDAATGALARVPFVSAAPAAAAEGAPHGPAAGARPEGVPAPVFTVVDVAGDLVTLSGAAAGVTRLRLGAVLGSEGGTVARLVVVEVVEGGLVARVVEGREHVAPGAQVRFAPAP